MTCMGGELRCVNQDAMVGVGPEGVPAMNQLAVDLMGWQVVHNATHDLQLKEATLVATALAIAQMFLYYNLYDDMVAKRDTAIDNQMTFIATLDGLKAQDLPMLRKKKSSVGMPLPDKRPCDEAQRYINESMHDGYAVEETACRLSEQACGGVPNGWGTHDGQLYGAAAGCYAAGTLAGNTKRRWESFVKKKAPIVQAGQAGMKAVYKADDILAKYAQATAIYAGLSDLFVQGFNSAGASLGVALGRLSNMSGMNSQTVSSAAKSTGSNGPAHGAMTVGAD